MWKKSQDKEKNQFEGRLLIHEHKSIHDILERDVTSCKLS